MVALTRTDTQQSISRQPYSSNFFRDYLKENSRDSSPVCQNSRAYLLAAIRMRKKLTVSVLLLAVMVAGVMVLDAVREVIVRMRHVVVIMVPVLVGPSDLLGVAYHRSVEVLERVRVSGVRLAAQQSRQSQNRQDELRGIVH